MPAPKDPEKLAAYREKQRKIALERGYGKWMSGKKLSENTMEKMRKAQQEKGNDPEERERRSQRAKTLGYGKWMAGRPAHQKVIDYARSRRGKTYEEIYGEARADKQRQARVQANKEAKAGKRPEHLLKLQYEIAEKRRGKSYTEIYGDSADEEIKKRTDTHRKRADALPKKADQRPKHNGDYKYKDWRTAVFQRDEYTCRDCGPRGGQIQAHHIKSWSKYPDLRYVVSNGRTLCISCHNEANRIQVINERST
ncbi:MAG: HNH endonuclease signature motif containing protein [Ktedonobacteraceae bacterium]